MECLGREGDTKMLWDTDKPDEVEAAKKQFDFLKGKGYVAFKVDKDGKQLTERVTAFDGTLGRIIMLPQYAGG
jgi:hypothetical protein